MEIIEHLPVEKEERVLIDGELQKDGERSANCFDCAVLKFFIFGHCLNFLLYLESGRGGGSELKFIDGKV